jgi:hypothetical protein
MSDDAEIKVEKPWSIKLAMEGRDHGEEVWWYIYPPNKDEGGKAYEKLREAFTESRTRTSMTSVIHRIVSVDFTDGQMHDVDVFYVQALEWSVVDACCEE